MIDKNLILINSLKEKIEDFAKKENYSNVEDKYLNGCCSQLVSHLLKLNENKGIPYRLSEYLGSGNSTIHFVYKSENGLFYDINGSFKTIEDIAKTSQLFNDLSSLDVDIDFEEPYKDDYCTGEFDYINSIIENIKINIQ